MNWQTFISIVHKIFFAIFFKLIDNIDFVNVIYAGIYFSAIVFSMRITGISSYPYPQASINHILPRLHIYTFVITFVLLKIKIKTV
jgi:hypothetical protein